LQLDQIAQLRMAIFHVRKKPFGSFQASLAITMSLENHGFVLEPKAYDAMADMLA